MRRMKYSMKTCKAGSLEKTCFRKTMALQVNKK
jgi:hypothetical protein